MCPWKTTSFCRKVLLSCKVVHGSAGSCILCMKKKAGEPTSVQNHEWPVKLYRPKVFSEKVSAITRMRQKCVRDASEMRQRCVKNASKMRHNGSCFFWNKRNISKCIKMRGTPLGENTFWTTPKFVFRCKRDIHDQLLLQGLLCLQR